MMPVRAMHTAPVEIWPRLSSLQRRIAEAARLFLFLDFDGTLAPISQSDTSIAGIPFQGPTRIEGSECFAAAILCSTWKRAWRADRANDSPQESVSHFLQVGVYFG